MLPSQSASVFFTKTLLKWHHEENERTLPWKEESDPYKIWLSEIILQQTRAEQGLPYYNKFIAAYPDIHALAAAPEDEVFRLWQGLGYYNRCRNLLETARNISRERKGIFPGAFEEILKLKGVGPYTAAAIASFAYNLPHAVVDGNVYRVLSRYFGIELAIDGNEGKSFFQQLADRLLDKKQPGAYNQAIMDFGSTICKPKAPLCESCCLARNCTAYINGLVDELPVKEKKSKVKERYFDYLVLCVGAEIYIRQRTGKDIWQNLYEYYLVEHRGNQSYTDSADWEAIKSYVVKQKGPVFSNRQRLTHQLIHSRFYIITLRAKPDILTSGMWISKDSLNNYAFPLTILSFSDIKKYF